MTLLFVGPEDLNGPKSGIVGQGITIPDSWGPLGAILGHLGPFLSDFGAQSKRLGSVLRLFLICLAAQNDLNCPKSGTVGQGNYQT